MFQRAYLEITNVCNLACAFCPGTTREKRFMAPEDFALLAKKLRPYTEYLYLHVMGEPLLHPQLAEILRSIRSEEPAVICDLVLDQVSDSYLGKERDDLTIMTAKLL